MGICRKRRNGGRRGRDNRMNDTLNAAPSGDPPRTEGIPAERRAQTKFRGSEKQTGNFCLRFRAFRNCVLIYAQFFDGRLFRKSAPFPGADFRLKNAFLPRYIAGTLYQRARFQFAKFSADVYGIFPFFAHFPPIPDKPAGRRREFSPLRLAFPIPPFP